MIIGLLIPAFIAYGIWLDGGPITNIVLAFIVIMSLMQIIVAAMICMDDPRADVVRDKLKARPRWRVRLFHLIDVALLTGMAAQAWWIIGALFFAQAACAFTAEQHIKDTL